MKKYLRRVIGQHSPLRLGWHWCKALAAALRYGFPARKLTVIGVTGTDGKTTTVGMIAHTLNASGYRTAALSTAFFQIGTTIQWNATQKTSPSPMVIQAFLRRAARSGCTHAVLECSSHGLTQHRLNWTWPTIAVMTNLSEEHLDYHGSMHNYLAAKGKLFAMLPPWGMAVLNDDDQSAPKLRSIITSKVTSYRTYPEPIITREGQQEAVTLLLAIPGRFNRDNALAAIAACKACGISAAAGSEALASFRGIPGRIEKLSEGGAMNVYVDFTVTPRSYDVVLTTLRESLPSGGKLLVLAGSCGDRMKEKRPIVGALLSRLADYSIVTNEDPYTEDPERIIDDVLSGMPKDHAVFKELAPSPLPERCTVRISDRRTAIRLLLSLARPMDTVLFCGKGSDTTMMIGETQIPWDERAIIREELAALGASSKRGS